MMSGSADQLKYRPLNADDISQFIRLFHEECKESPVLSKQNLNDDSLRNMCHWFLKEQGNSIFTQGVFIANELVGAFVGRCDVNIPFDDIVAVDLLFYIRSDYRGNGFVAKRLLQMYASWANSKGAVETKLTISSGIDTRYQALLERLGWEVTPTTELKI